MLDSCATLLHSFFLDWQATVQLLQLPQYGRTVLEANQMIRQIGPDLYFGPIMLWTARHCGDLPWWVTVGQWLLTNQALQGHVALGTATQLPYLVFRF